MAKIIDVTNTIGKHKYKDEITIESLIRQMDRSNVDIAVIHCYPEYEDNESIEQAIKRYPNRIIGMYVVNPWKEKAEELLEKAFKEKGFKGLYLDPLRQGFSYTETKLFYPLLEICSRYDYPVWCFASSDINCNQILIDKIYNYFPNLKIILGRMGLQYDNSSAVEVARSHKNVYLETSTSMDFNVFRAVKRAGDDKVLMGTGTPDISYFELEIAKIRDIIESEESIIKVLGENAKNVFKVKEI